MKNVTIYDVAERANVSPSTVSRVMGSSHHPVSKQIREKILEAAKELDYIPNIQARALKTQNNSSVGVIIPSIDNPFYPQLVRGMSDEAMSRGISIYLSNCDREYTLTDQQIQTMLAQNVKGIVSIYIDRTTPSLERFVDRGGILVSLCGNNFAYNRAYNFQTDKVKESVIAVEYLLSLGHKKIALMMNDMNCQIREDKFHGYQFALEKNGIPFNERYLYIYKEEIGGTPNTVKHGDADRGISLTKQLLERSPEVTAIVCMNDIMALGVCAELKSRTLRVPDDYSVMGFDDAFFSEYCNPSLTTIALEKYDWGKTIMKFMIDKLEMPSTDLNDRMVPNNLLPPVHLIIRESTGIPRANKL